MLPARVTSFTNFPKQGHEQKERRAVSKTLDACRKYSDMMANLRNGGRRSKQKAFASSVLCV